MNRREKPKQAVFLLIAELLRSDRLPPVTLAVIALNVVIYLELFDLKLPSLTAVCISANAIIKHKQWAKLILSTVFHADDWHLYYNMVSFSIKGRSLEQKYGSRHFFAIIAVFTVMCSIFYVGIELLAFNLFKDYNYLESCAVGFSGVIFALKVLTTHNLPDGTVYMFNTIPMPSKYAYWGELIAISLVTPNASFAGHLAGILVGLLYIYGPLKYLINTICPRDRVEGYHRQYNFDDYSNNFFANFRNNFS